MTASQDPSPSEKPNKQLEAPAPSRPAERARAREISSYLAAASISPTTPRLVTEAPENPPARSPDPNLTALVQLGALRLDCERSFFSLIDGKTQYIVAEATKTTSLAVGGGASAEHDLLLGTMLLDKNWGVCPRTMEYFTDDEGNLTCDDPNIIADSTRYIIKDFRADAGFRERPYVKGWPFMRSYAEVPIISPLGYVIGGFCVVDNKLRDFDDDTIRVLSEIGVTISSHLEHVRMRHNQSRSEKLIRGLDIFIQEEATLQASRKDSNARQRSGIIVESSESTESVVESSSEKVLTDGDVTADPELTTDLPERPAPAKRGSTASATSGSSMSTAKEPTLPVELRRAFERSSALIRESLLMDGLVFLDASPLSFGSRSKYLDLEDPAQDSEEDLSLPNHISTSVICPILASSHAAPNDTSSPAVSVRFSEQLLYRIIRRFPRGQLFSADEYGSFEKIDPGASNGPFRPDLSRSSDGTRDDIDELFKLIPDARSVVFLPLWHFQKERWFAAAIGWTCDPSHSFDPSDATYLSAFGNSIMAEVLRYEALAVSRAKSDFISSISHEIRSPLHGILATTELLGETVTSNEEKSMLSMIESCGTTLLDTLNHLLEFAKINNLGQARNKVAEQRSAFLSFVDLSKLVEDVTESVAAGHAFETNPYRQSSAHTTTPVALSPDEGPVGLPVLVTLSIQPFEGWEVPLDTGAWKRIVMNLIGNALKYTPKGQIQVKLEIKKHGDQQTICFSVKDTGIGMSDEYLKYRLFTPFAQENTFSSGTGLGLCIVHQIVTDLGGKLDVRSEVGVGTCISVLIPLDKIEPSGAPLAEKPPVELNVLSGRTLCYVAPTQRLMDERSTNGGTWLPLDHAEALKTSVTNIVTKWLDMKVVYGASIDEVRADVYIVDKTFDTMSESINLSTLFTKPVIVISNARSNPRTPLLKFLRTPIGPRQLGSVIKYMLSRVTHPEKNPEVAIKAGSSDTIETINSAAPTPSDEKISLSLTLPPFTRHITPPQNNDHMNSTKQHVLAVDDNTINLKILTKLLKQLNCTYASATNGLEAVSIFKSTPRPFSLIFMDINMPVMDGFEAAQQIRAHEREMGIPTGQVTRIVALTGLGNAASQREAFTSGMDLFLTKPVSLAKLKGMLVLPKGEAEKPK